MLVSTFRIQTIYKAIVIACIVVFALHLAYQNVSYLNSVDVRRQSQYVAQVQKEDSEVTKAVKENVRVFCWIMTDESSDGKRAILVNETWAPRCNKYSFVNAPNGTNLPTLNLNFIHGYDYLWSKTKAAFKYLYENELNNYDWFFKADDDTYAIVENLRLMLLAYSPDDPIYFGMRFKYFGKYMSGGAGYVLSREALRRFGQGLSDPEKCDPNEKGTEDILMGNCLEKSGVVAGDSRDRLGKHRFLPVGPIDHFQNHTPDWVTSYSYYPYKGGSECCSNYVISFHYVRDDMVHLLHDFLYHVRSFGVSDDFNVPQLARSLRVPLIDAAREVAKNLSAPNNGSQVTSVVPQTPN